MARPRLLWKMIKNISTPPRLAPLQRVMLRDSLAEENAGHHVEQVEIRFAPGEWRDRVAASWQETVARTEALRLAFTVGNGEPAGFESAWSPTLLFLQETLPASWEAWLTADRHRPLLAARAVPWRAVYWPCAGRFLWTFHHALLDGRSITTILRSFLARLAEKPAEHLSLAEWHSPTADALALADRMFREDFPQQTQEKSFPDEADEGPARRCLGDTFRKRLAAMALAWEVTPATVLIWAWGQALAGASGTDSVVVEQVRSGAPQRGTAGFTMHTLPVVIPRAADESIESSLHELRKHLLALRAIEGVSPADFLPGVFPDVDRAGSSVIMIEHATPQHLLETEMVESLILHESKGETLLATAHILPDLRMEVEGPGRHGLLEAWVRVLSSL